MYGALSWRVFWSVCIAAALVLTVYIWGLFPLYVSGDMRARVRATVEGTAAREGWLLSDLSLLRVTDNTVLLLRREHRRGTDVITCHRINTYNGALQTCR